MSSTSRKHRDFVNEPIRNKCVHDLPGIGGAYGNRLSERGYGTARQVGANAKSSGDCYKALKDWTDQYM